MKTTILVKYHKSDLTWTGHRFTNEMTSQVAKFQVLFDDYPDRIELGEGGAKRPCGAKGPPLK